MALHKYFLTSLLLSITCIVTAQIPAHLFNGTTLNEYATKDFTLAKTPVSQRMGVYHFGDSESEWDLVMLKNGDSIILQVWNGTWAPNYYTKKDGWQKQCKTFNHVTVAGNKIAFGMYSGMFADFKEDNKTTNALLLYGDPIQGKNYQPDNAEVGYYTSTAKAFYNNTERYELSLTIRPDSYFKGKSKQELKIMRNTIYANYGYIFQAGGDMETYFKGKDWYAPFLKDVSNCLTTIEIKNIQTISSLEAVGTETPESILKYFQNKNIDKIIASATYPFKMDVGGPTNDAIITDAATLRKRLTALYANDWFSDIKKIKPKKLSPLQYGFESRSFNKEGELESESMLGFDFKQTDEGYKVCGAWIAG